MDITTAGKGVDIGESLQQHMRTQLNDAVEKYFDRAVSAHVTLSREGGKFRADIAVHAGRGIDVQGHAAADDPYQAFDKSADHVAKRLRRFKRRLKDHHANGEMNGFAAQRYVLQAPEGSVNDSDEAEEDNLPEADNAVVVAETKTLVLAMSVAEAVMHLDLGGHEALMFRNRANDRLNTVYRRSDGNIGWIDPEGA